MAKNEEALIALLQAEFPRFSRGLGIGDDAAILRTRGDVAITSDMLVEDVDFTLEIPPRFIASKSLHANLSDIAAMGARPFAFLLDLGIPAHYEHSIAEWIRWLGESARAANVELLGGDLSAAAKLTIAVTMFGEFADPPRPLLRSAARPGDHIFVSRPLGGSAAGLALLERGWRIDAESNVSREGVTTVGFAQREFAESAILRHVDPRAETDLGPLLAMRPEVHACIDISDGLSSDLTRLCRASNTGAVVDLHRIPLVQDLAQVAQAIGINWEDAALHGGEEYALLFTADSREAALSQVLKRPVYAIGRITASKEILLERDGGSEPLAARGFDHFA